MEKSSFVGHPVVVAKQFSDIHQLKRCPWDEDRCSTIISILTTRNTFRQNWKKKTKIKKEFGIKIEESADLQLEVRQGKRDAIKYRC